MRVLLLGPVSAETDGVPLRLGGRKQRAVFALLALQVNRPVALDRLVDELWRDEPPAQATLSLQSYISRLRRAISDARSKDQPDDEPDDGSVPRILTHPPGWALMMPAEDVDAVRFVDLAREGSSLLEAADVAKGALKLREALALWTGDALADLDDMPFASGEKARLQNLRASTIESLLWAELDLGRPAEVAEMARRAVLENPHRERAWCALMLALYRLGRQSEALEVAHELRGILTDGLGLDPSPEVRLLQEQILTQDPTLDQQAHVRLSPAHPGLLEAVSEPEVSGSAGFVGRHDVTEALDGVTKDATSGHGQFVIVDGPAGMGKSAVLEELTARLQTSDALVLRGGGVSAGASPALWPWVAMVRQLVAADPEVTESARTGGSAAALALLDPSVVRGGESEGFATEIDPVLARTRLYRAVVDLLAQAHRARPLALVVDDAHWLDPDTLGLLALAADELLPRGVVVAVALRADEAPAVSDEIDAVAARHHARTMRLSLTGLTTADVEELIRRTNPEAAHVQLAPALVARTGGNPFFLTELLRLLTSERNLDVPSVNTVLPHQVRDVLRRRIDRLPDRTQSLLNVVALLNRPAELRLLTGVTGLSDEVALDDAEAALASSLLIEDPASGGFLLSHDLVRQTLEEMLSANRLARMHARIAEVMQADEQESPTMLPEVVVEIARHLVLAESVVGANAAIPYLIAVADDARSRAAFHLVERALRTALQLSGRVADPARRNVLQLELRTRLVVQSNIISGSLDSPILGGSDETTDPGASWVETDPIAWWGAQVVHVLEGRAGQALELAQEASARDLPGSVNAMVLSVAGLCCFVTGRFESADHQLRLSEEQAEQARTRTPDNHDPWLAAIRVSVPALRSANAVLAEDWAGAEAHLNRARELARGSTNELVYVERYAAWGAALCGDAGTALRHASAALELAQQLGDSYFFLPMSRILVGWATAMNGDPQGVGVVRAACSECEALSLRFLSPVHLLLCAEASARHGQLDDARALVLESRAMAQLTGEKTVNRRLEKVAAQILPEAQGDPSD